MNLTKDDYKEIQDQYYKKLAEKDEDFKKNLLYATDMKAFYRVKHDFEKNWVYITTDYYDYSEIEEINVGYGWK